MLTYVRHRYVIRIYKCEGILTEYECANALKQMQNSKSPGFDGLSVEFYKNILERHNSIKFNYFFSNKNLTELQKQGLITLLPIQTKICPFWQTGDQSVL